MSNDDDDDDDDNDDYNNDDERERFDSILNRSMNSFEGKHDEKTPTVRALDYVLTGVSLGH